MSALEFLNHLAATPVAHISTTERGCVAAFEHNGRTRWTIEYTTLDGQLSRLSIFDVNTGLKLLVPHPDNLETEPVLGRIVDNLRHATTT